MVRAYRDGAMQQTRAAQHGRAPTPHPRLWAPSAFMGPIFRRTPIRVYRPHPRLWVQFRIAVRADRRPLAPKKIPFRDRDRFRRVEPQLVDLDRASLPQLFERRLHGVVVPVASCLPIVR